MNSLFIEQEPSKIYINNLPSDDHTIFIATFFGFILGLFADYVKRRFEEIKITKIISQTFFNEISTFDLSLEKTINKLNSLKLETHNKSVYFVHNDIRITYLDLYINSLLLFDKEVRIHLFYYIRMIESIRATSYNLSVAFSDKSNLPEKIFLNNIIDSHIKQHQDLEEIICGVIFYIDQKSIDKYINKNYIQNCKNRENIDKFNDFVKKSTEEGSTVKINNICQMTNLSPVTIGLMIKNDNRFKIMNDHFIINRLS